NSLHLDTAPEGERSGGGARGVVDHLESADQYFAKAEADTEVGLTKADIRRHDREKRRESRDQQRAERQEGRNQRRAERGKENTDYSEVELAKIVEEWRK